MTCATILPSVFNRMHTHQLLFTGLLAFRVTPPCPPTCTAPLQGDLPAAAVRRMIGPDAILGVSVKTVAEVGPGGRISCVCGVCVCVCACGCVCVWGGGL